MLRIPWASTSFSIPLPRKRDTRYVPRSSTFSSFSPIVVDSRNFPHVSPLKQLRSLVVGGLKTARWTLFNLHNIAAYGALAALGLAFTPGFYKLANSVAQTGDLKLVPKPTPTRITNEHRYGYPFDNFFQNFNGFDQIVDAIEKAGIDPHSLDKNKSNTILDSSKDVQELISKLAEAKNNSTRPSDKEVYDNAIKLVSDIDALNKLIWGVNGPNPDSVSQNYEPNCQGMAVLRGLLLTPQGIQESKGIIRVTSYNLDKDPQKFYINFAVGDIEIPWSELALVMNPKGYIPSKSSDNSLYTAVLRTALKKGLPDTVPNIFPSASPTLLTNKTYSPVMLWALSDSHVDDILSHAPGTLITVASTFTLNDMKAGIALRQEAKKPEAYSELRAEQFKQLYANQAQAIASHDTSTTVASTAEPKISLPPFVFSIPLPQLFPSLPIPISLPITLPQIIPRSALAHETKPVAPTFPPSSPSSPVANLSTSMAQKKELTTKDMTQGHVYVAENYDKTTGILTVSDTNGSRIKIPRDEIRQHLIAVVAPNDLIGDLDWRMLPAWTFVMGAGASWYFGQREAKRVIRKGVASLLAYKNQ